jgi:zinc/manganese transport system permease protein
MNILNLMAAPFAECLVLVAIHTYLGIHVLRRRVIFVDLALAQIAALGTTVGFIFGIMPETPGALIFSIAFTFIGAAVFSVTRFRNEKIPQEAIIGLTYAIACAVAILVVEKTTGAEHIKDILVGNLLWVTWADVASASVVYLIVGLIHFIFRKQFFLISNDPQRAFQAGLSVRAWDFLFYLTFGVVISFSTRVAGVLMVFVFLVAPAILAFLITDRLRLQLLIGWATGTIVTTIGLYLSWVIDLPSGPTVIAFYGIALVIGVVIVRIIRAKNRSTALLEAVAGAAVTAFIGLSIWGSGHLIASTGFAVNDEANQINAEVTKEKETTEIRDSNSRENRKARLASTLGTCTVQKQIEKYLSVFDLEDRLAFVKDTLVKSKTVGLKFLLIALSDEELPLLYREEYSDLLVNALDENPHYDPRASISENAQALKRICDGIVGVGK